MINKGINQSWVGHTDVWPTRQDRSEKSHLCLCPCPGVSCRWRSVIQLKSAKVLWWCDRGGNTSGRLIGEELFPSSSVYHCLCSLNRCHFFFVLRYLSLQTSSFPLKWKVVLPQHSGCQDVTVPPQIRVWGIVFYCYLLSDDRCYFVCGTPGILHFRVRTTPQIHLFSISLFDNHQSRLVFPSQFCLLWTSLQETHPLKHFWCWNIVLHTGSTIWSIVTRRTLGLDFFPFRYLIVHLSPTLFLDYDLYTMDPSIFTCFGTTRASSFGSLLRLVRSISKCGYPRVTTLSAVSFTEIRSSFRYLRFFIHY